MKNEKLQHSTFRPSVWRFPHDALAFNRNGINTPQQSTYIHSPLLSRIPGHRQSHRLRTTAGPTDRHRSFGLTQSHTNVPVHHYTGRQGRYRRDVIISRLTPRSRKRNDEITPQRFRICGRVFSCGAGGRGRPHGGTGEWSVLTGRVVAERLRPAAYGARTVVLDGRVYSPQSTGRGPRYGA